MCVYAFRFILIVNVSTPDENKSNTHAAGNYDLACVH